VIRSASDPPASDLPSSDPPASDLPPSDPPPNDLPPNDPPPSDAPSDPPSPDRQQPGTDPPWLAPLVDRAARATWADLSRFAPPSDGSGRPSAVLVLLCDTERGPAVVLLERAATMRRHAGQVAFPGGAVDADDTDLAATALREAEEEVGLDPATVDVLMTLPALYLPPSDFVVTPVLGYWRDPHPLVRMQPGEVSAVAVAPLAELTDPANRFTVRHPSGYSGPGFQASALFVWGFTAGVLDAVLRMGGWERDWDVSVTRTLPPLAQPAAGTVET
jgi:8-oxo-dGTP pyrophosphatase MutT (NUDIX family)